MLLYFEKITDPNLVQSFVILCLMSFIFSFFIILTAGYFFGRRSKYDEIAVQSAHKGMVPRMGGIAVYLSILIFVLISNSGQLNFSFFPNLDIGQLYWLVISLIPVFLIGLAEDLGYAMSPTKRFLASVISGVLVILYFQTWISSLGIPVVDLVLSSTFVGILFTLFAATGVVNAFNLIDGLNGLASYVSISSAIFLSIIAFNSNNAEIVRFLFIISASSIGFFVLNFPFGKIFLGDAGAYTLGHLLVWCAILLINSNSSISPFAIFLIFFWPIADTLLSIWRRWRLKKNAVQPDRLHFHQLVMRFLEIRFLGRDKRNVANPIATIVLVPAISFPQAIGVIFWNNFVASAVGALFVGSLFLCTYFVGINLAKKSHSVI